MPKWNAQQKKAIETKQKNILVSASAGSGKTTVLIARLMDLVMKDHISIDEICAMTFTEAAANEMKKRLASELQKAYAAAQSMEEKAFITKQLTNLQTAHISTIHSFCLSIIQKYYYIIGLSKKRIANIMDNAAMTHYQDAAMSQAFQRQYEQQDPIFLELCMMFSSRPENDDMLQKTIAKLATTASSKADSDAWLNRLCDTYSSCKQINDLPKELLDYFYDYLTIQSLRYQELLNSLLERYRLRYYEEEKKHALLQAKCDLLPTLFEALKNRNYMDYRQLFINICHGIVPTSPDKEDKEYTRLRKESQELEDSLLAILYREDTLIRDMTKLAPYVQKLVCMCQDYRQSYAALKAKHEMIDFDDMEHFALAILQANQGSIAKLYREQFVEIMVDEFQDSNDVQNSLVQLICRENNVFRVGDIKQSIYSFRHAKPDLMKSLIEQKGENDEVIYLSNNYRSKKMIVDFNNELFKILMNMDRFSCSYRKEDDVDTGVPAQEENNVPICFHAIFHDEIKEVQQLIVAKNTLKANYIANQIIHIKDKEKRQWKDFVVLVRSNARKDNLKATFDELNIPYFIDIKYGFYQSSSVQVILSTLKALCNPHDDISFVACMMSPLWNYSAQAMAEIKLKKDKQESYYRYMSKHTPDELADFEALRQKRYTYKLHEIINQLFLFHDYYAKHTSIQEKTNLDLLFEKAIQFEAKEAGSLESFLAQIDQIQDAQTAEAIPVGSEADVVRVMSIHQSKGLQFPVVFLWSSDKQTPIEFKDFCILDAELGIGMKAMELPKRYVRTTLPRIAMEHKKDKEELEEEMRILYVATTRAQQQMHIVDCILSLEPYRHPLTTSDIYKRKGYTAWILQAFLSMQSPLFTLKEVHHLWENQVQTKQATTYKKLPIYTKEVSSWRLSTASEQNINTTEPFQWKQKNDGTIYGSAMHKLVELSQGKSLTPKEYTALAETINFTLHDSDIKKLNALQSNPIYQNALQVWHSYEMPFNVAIHDEILHGYMDFVSIGEQDIILIDFKTDATLDAQELTKHYREQLHTYQRALQALYPRHQIHAYLYSFALNQMLPIQ